jgi:hypothetical protein
MNLFIHKPYKIVLDIQLHMCEVRFIHIRQDITNNFIDFTRRFAKTLKVVSEMFHVPSLKK